MDLDEATESLAAGAPGADDAYATALDRWLNLGGADLEERAAKVITTLGLRVDLDRAMTGLSGGQAARANLASLLLSRYDVFLLDEPTNDLDIAGLEILEDFVRKLRAATVLVSHDRAFLERTVDRVLELDLAQQKTRLYGGGYAGYLEERETARRHARENYEQYAETKAELEARRRTQIGWADKGVREARSKATDKDKHVLHAQVARSEKLAGKVKATERMIGRLEVAEEPRKEWQLQMEIAAAPRSGSVAAVMREAVVDRGAFRLGPVSLQIDWADRVTVTGPNGAGKSTLIDALLGRVPLTSGQASLGSGIMIGEVDQARSLFRGEQPLLDAFAAQLPDMVPAEIRTLLAKYGLKADHVTRPAGQPVPRRAHPRRAGPAPGPRGEPAHPRRADQPPRPARHRAARIGPRRLPRHLPAGHPRPPDARRPLGHPPPGRTARSPRWADRREERSPKRHFLLLPKVCAEPPACRPIRANIIIVCSLRCYTTQTTHDHGCGLLCPFLVLTRRHGRPFAVIRGYRRRAARGEQRPVLAEVRRVEHGHRQLRGRPDGRRQVNGASPTRTSASQPAPLGRAAVTVPVTTSPRAGSAPGTTRSGCTRDGPQQRPHRARAPESGQRRTGARSGSAGTKPR